MSSVKAIPEGLKWVECERGVGGKNSPIRYIPEQDPQMGLDTDFAAAEKAVETAKIEAELAKQDYVTVRNAEKKKKGNKQEAPGTTAEAASPALVEAKATYDKVLKALEDAASPSQRLEQSPSSFMETSSPTRHPWEKIIKAQVTKAPWEDIKGVPHLLQVFRHDAGEALKYYITNTLKKPNRVSIRQFFVRVEQLNSYLETLPCLYYSPKANQATKKVLPLDDADLATHLLRMCPAKWQTQYDLTENTTQVSTRALLLVLENIENNAELDNKPASTTKAKGADTKRKMESMDSRIPKKPKKVGWTEKHCVLCKKHGGPHKSHNTRDCRRYNKDGTPIKKNGGAGNTNFAQIVRAELKKALRKKSSKRKKLRANDSESDSDSGDSS
eukprot:CCRYP_005976-RA/>CCRYP_005976-RA protein AED:0.46 eAED:0.82 QI:0/0/0/1/0.5/0.33/3/0/385